MCDSFRSRTLMGRMFSLTRSFNTGVFPEGADVSGMLRCP
jgi:hypothetical protein